MSATRYTRDEVAKHNTAESNWIIIDDKVYDVTKFARFHPGGKAFVDASAGSDATKNFYAFHRQDVLKSMASKYLIGTLVDAPSAKKASVTRKGWSRSNRGGIATVDGTPRRGQRASSYLILPILGF